MSSTTPEDGEDLRAVVREKYGAAALRVNAGGSSCCGASAASGCGPDPITSNLYVGDEASAVPAEALAASLGCGNPTALAELHAGRDRARPRLRRRHRRAALGAARRPDRQGLRSRHDRRDARPGPREPAEVGAHERRVPEGRDRAHPAAGQQRGRDHLELRDQPVGRQGPRARGGVPRAEARRPLRGVGRRRAR